MSVTRILSSAAIVLAMSTTAIAQTSDNKTTQSDATAQPDQVKSSGEKDNPVLLNNYAQAMGVAATGEDETTTGEDETSDFYRIEGHQGSKSPIKLDPDDCLGCGPGGPGAGVEVQERANINTSRSNKLAGINAGPAGDTPDIGDVTPRADTYGATRSNRGSGSGIINPREGCVTTTGAVDMNCDGVADAARIEGDKASEHEKDGGWKHGQSPRF